MGDTTRAPHVRSASRALQTMSVFLLFSTMAAKDPDIINIPDEGDEGDNDWQDVGPINIEEAKAYKEKVDAIFKTMSMILTDDRKDAIHVTVTTFKKLAAKHWAVMKDADVEVVVSIHPSMMPLGFIYGRL